MRFLLRKKPICRQYFFTKTSAEQKNHWATIPIRHFSLLRRSSADKRVSLPLRCSPILFCVAAVWLAGCTSLLPLRPNCASSPENSVETRDDYNVASIQVSEQDAYEYD